MTDIQKNNPIFENKNKIELNFEIEINELASVLNAF